MNHDTDQDNLTEFARFRLSLAVSIFNQRLDYGLPRTAARAEALVYLRRKTGWTEATAAGALDSAIEIRDKTEDLDRTVPLNESEIHL